VSEAGHSDRAFSLTAERIISLLNESKTPFISGEELSRSLNISRSAVWKQIKSLRTLGFIISAEPSRGYRLISAPDRLLASSITPLLKSERIGGKIISVEETVSTNSVSFRMAEEGAAEGSVVIAECQTGGKGRLGRNWASPPRVNLYCSIILRPPIQPVAAPQLTFLSAVAVARAIEGLTTLKVRIKWPNDILIGGKKVAGLLNEMSAETDKVNFVILGIGVNLNMSQELFPVDLRHPATSLFVESGIKVDRTAFTVALLQELDSLYATFLSQGYAPARREWLERSRLEGVLVTVTDNNSVRSGRVTGIDEYGALLLDSGERILAGDLVIGG
jgi:BirA family biotin operon repressor/biotin-[acetyl-CoA-carboxylase] ligase